MPIDDNLARWSDISFETAFVVYLLAAILFIAQLRRARIDAGIRVVAVTLTLPLAVTVRAALLVVQHPGSVRRPRRLRPTGPPMSR